jgi:hypothetical protein
MIKEMKAVSTLVVILLILCSLIVGGLLSYMWVISGYYYESSSTDLIITEALFPLEHADYFNLTIMNPSHSSTTNITGIYIKTEDNMTVQAVTDTSPELLPIQIERATSKTIKCLKNWSPLAGKSITVHVLTSDSTGTSKTVDTQPVKLEIAAEVNPTISLKRFNITVRNPVESTRNLTLARVLVNQVSVQNTTLTLPSNLSVGSMVTIECTYNLEDLEEPVIRVETEEGYYAEVATNIVAKLEWSVTEVLFNEENSTDMNVTIFNPDTSSIYVDICNITLVYGNTTSYINGSLTNPPFVPYYRLNSSETVTFGNCTWDWGSNRSQNVTLNVYTLQESAPATLAMRTPDPVNFRIAAMNFNLSDTGHFLMNISNAATSTEAITPIRISLNGNNASFTSQVIHVGETPQFSCTFDWSSLRGTIATVNVSTANGLYSSGSIAMPSVDLTISDTIGFNETAEGFVYVNVTVTNSASSTRSVTITEITFTTPNSTDIINGTIPRFVPNGYPLAIDAKVALVCPWYWKDYYDQTLTVTVKTAEGFSTTRTFPTPASTP